MPDLVPANAPPASYADFTAAQRSLYGAGMLPKLNIAIGSQLPGGAQEAANGAALSALPNMPPPATLPPTTPRGGGGRAVGGTFLSALFGPSNAGGQGHQVPPARPVAPVPPAAPAPAASLGGGAPPETGGMAAAPNVIQGGAFPPSEVAGMVHPAEHAIAYQQNLARQRDIQPFNGTNTNEFTTLDANSPRMEGPAPAAPNIIRAGIPSGGGGGGMNAIQAQAIAPLVEARLRAQADQTMASKKFVVDETQKEYELQRELAQAQQARDQKRIDAAQNGLAWMQSSAHQNLMLQHKIAAGLVLPTMESTGIKP